MDGSWHTQGFQPNHHTDYSGETLRSASSRLRVLVAASAVVLGLALSMRAQLACADVISFPEEELASESVLPVFDHPVSVKNRNVLIARRIEIGVVGGMSLLEPFYTPFTYGLTGAYHITEEHAFNLTGIFFLPGLSSNANNLNPVPGSKDANGNPIYVNLQYAPAPKYFLIGDYQYTGFYGKISLSKETVLNLSLYGLAGLGAYGVGDTIVPSIDIGLGQKLYLTPNLGIRADFRLIAFQGPNVLTRNLSTATQSQSASSFGTTTSYVSMLSLGLIYLFPGGG